MNNQGLFGALDQFWTVNEKPRLDRRNTYFEDIQPSNYDALKFAMVSSTVATAIIIFWSVIGVIL